jgi:DNA-binding winged helix-turn-helix (wHTH) protein
LDCCCCSVVFELLINLLGNFRPVPQPGAATLLYSFGDCTLDDQRRELWRAGAPVSVGPQVFDLLAYLLQNRERVVSQDDLLAAVWKGRIVSESTLRSQINAARGAIGDDGEAQRLIRTMPRKGFRFVAEVREQPDEQPAGTLPVAATDGNALLAPRPAPEPASEDDPHAASPVVVFEPGHAPPLTTPVPWQPKNRTHELILIGCAAVLLAIVVSAVTLLLYRGSAQNARQASAPPAPQEVNTLVPEEVPYISDPDQATIREVYLPAPDYKALALGFETMGFAVAKPDKRTAEIAALESCEKIASERPPHPENPCELYAFGNAMISKRPLPPMPPRPWIVRNPSIERPFVVNDIPLISDAGKREFGSYANARKPKALALSVTGNLDGRFNQANLEQAVRRALQRCGFSSRKACMIIEIDDQFIVPIPKLMKVVGFVASGIKDLAPKLKEDVSLRLAGANTGWNAVAVGASGNAGLKLGAGSEQAAMDGAMDECGRQDRECHVVAIGPFLVEPKP